MGYSTIRSFYEIDYHQFVQNLSDKIKAEIEGKGKEYILGVDEEEYKKFLIDKYTLTPLFVDLSSENIDKPIISKETLEDHFNRSYQADAYTFTIRYNYTGSSILFQVCPSTYSMTSADISLNEYNHTVSFSFKMYKKDPEEFKRAKSEMQRRAFANLDNINQSIVGWNQGLPSIVNRNFNGQKDKFLKENDFFAAINVKVNKDTTSVYTAPTITKKIVPQPTVSPNKEFSSEPTMSKEMYYDMLKVIYELGKSMEKKPSTYQKKDEEGLRDTFLLVLETRYEGTTATGETFNRGGKTDIILKYAKDGSNLFVAECKFWHGSSEFLNAISQLFDRYLTWRDSKTALLMFVTNKEFTNVIQTVKTDIKSHPYFDQENGSRGETSLSYKFHLPQDKEKTVMLEVILFHFDKQ